MQILIVAPFHPDLPNQLSEVATLASTLNAILLQGSVTEREIWSAISQHRTFTGIWFSSHAGAHGVVLSDEVIGMDVVANYLCVAECRWVVFNACEGYEFIQELQRYYPVDVVAAAVKGLQDKIAWRFAVVFSRRLAETGDIRLALQGLSVPYRFWPSPDGTGQIAVDDRKYEEIWRRVDELTRRIEEQSRILYEIKSEVNAQKQISDSRFAHLEQDDEHSVVPFNPVFWVFIVIVGIATLLNLIEQISSWTY